MKCLYITSDRIGTQTGGGVVTHNELEALKLIGRTTIINPTPTNDPFTADELALQEYNKIPDKFNLAHIYAGTYPRLVEQLKKDNVKVSYTAAAHDIKISQQEHAKLGMEYNYPHLTDPILLERYLQSYKQADLLICPSTHSKNVMLGFGCTNEIKVIPHGCYLPKEVKPLPKKFHVGYLGAIGPDKGLIYLLQAWKKLNYKDCYLTLAGKDTPALLPLVRQYGGGAIHLIGFVENVSDFYNSCSVVVQYSSSEGFGIEILEAMAHGRPVISSTNNGGPDVIANGGSIIEPMNTDVLAAEIDKYRNLDLNRLSDFARNEAQNYQWCNMHVRYYKAWEEIKDEK